MSDQTNRLSEAELARLEELLKFYDARTNDEHCCFCGDTYDLDGYEETGFCHTCGSGEFEKVLEQLPALLATARDYARLEKERDSLAVAGQAMATDFEKLDEKYAQLTAERDRLAEALRKIATCETSPASRDYLSPVMAKELASAAVEAAREETKA